MLPWQNLRLLSSKRKEGQRFFSDTSLSALSSANTQRKPILSTWLINLQAYCDKATVFFLEAISALFLVACYSIPWLNIPFSSKQGGFSPFEETSVISYFSDLEQGSLAGMASPTSMHD